MRLISLGIILFLLIPLIILGKDIIKVNKPQKISSQSLKDGLLRCFDEEKPNYCLDSFIKGYLKNKSTKTVLAELSKLQNETIEIERKCHPITHSIGRTTQLIQGSVDKAFKACDHTCNAGCYHGVIEQFLGQGSHITIDEIRSKASTVCPKNTTGGIYINCLHGLGHTIMFFLDYDLPNALPVCDKFGESLERDSCLTGVFMENVSPRDTKSKYISDKNLLYPCDSLDDKYKPACFGTITPHMAGAGLGADQIVNECKKAGAYYKYCIYSLGRVLAQKVKIDKNNEEVARFCEKRILLDKTDHCLLGVVEILVGFTWNGELAYPFCHTLSYPVMRTMCYNLAQWSMIDMGYKNREGAIADCQEFATGDPRCKTALDDLKDGDEVDILL